VSEPTITENVGVNGARNTVAAGWLNNCWQVAALEEELGQPFIARRIAGQPIILFRTEDDVAALEDSCPHRRVPLSVGYRADNEIVCGYHGLRFNAAGACTRIPGRNGPIGNLRVRRYPTISRWGMIWIWMGEPSLADPGLMPDLAWLGSDSWRSVTGYIHMTADYRLINDNLLDLSHESFVHEGSIANGAGETIGDYPVTVTSDGRVLWAERIMNDVAGQPAFAAYLPGRIDRSQRAVYMAPGLNLTDSKKSSRETDRYILNRTLHLLTPETERSTHYFFASSRNFNIGDEAADREMIAIAQRVFGEDKAMLETQQRVLDERPDLPMPGFAWSVDKAPVQARRMLDKLLAAERVDPRAIAAPTSIIKS